MPDARAGRSAPASNAAPEPARKRRRSIAIERIEPDGEVEVGRDRAGQQVAQLGEKLRKLFDFFALLQIGHGLIQRQFVRMDQGYGLIDCTHNMSRQYFPIWL